MDGATTSISEATSATSERLSPLTKLIFGSGDICGGGGQNIVNFLYLIFLTDVARIRPALAGLIFLAGRIWGAIIAPVMGVVTDRTRTRWGRRRPYFLAASVLIFVSYVLLWAPVTAADEWQRFAFYLAAYLLFGLVMTTTMVPYSAMSAELTLDYDERTSVMSYRLAFSMGASIVTAIFPIWIVERAPDPRTGYLVMAVVFGALFALPWGFIFKYCPERPSFHQQKLSLDWRDLLLDPWRLRAFRLLVGIYVAGFIALDVVSSLIVYFMTYNLGRPADAKFFMGATIGMQLLSLPLYARLASRIGKGRTYAVGGAWWIAVMLVFLAFDPAWPAFSIYLLAGAMGLGISAIAFVPWTIFPDTTEVAELATGDRREGTLSGFMTFLRKVASAVALFGVGQVLDVTGYRPPPEPAAGAVAVTAQPQAALTAIRLMLALAPIALGGLGVALALRYPLTAQMHARLRDILSFRRGEKEAGSAAEQEAMEASYKSLYETLVGAPPPAVREVTPASVPNR